MTFSGVIMAMFMAALDQTVISTAMPRIIADLGGFSQYTWVSSAYIIASAVIMPITGRLSDLYGRKLFYLLGMIIFLLSSVACGMSQDMTQMIASRAVKGLGAGIMMATGFTVIADLFPPAQRGKYTGYGSAVFAVSSIIGPTLGGYITDMFSWQWVFFINIPFSLLVIVLFILFFPDIPPQATDGKIDIFGVLLLTLTIVPFMTALAAGRGDPVLSGVRHCALFVFSGLMLVCFIWNECRFKNPIIPMGLFKNQIVLICYAVTFLTGFSMYGTIVFIPLYFQGVLGATAMISGNFLTPMMLGLVLGSIGSGQLLARTGGHYKIQGITGIAVLFTGLYLLTRMGAQTDLGTAVFNISLTGLGLGIAIPLHTIAVQNSVPYHMLGVATATTAFFRSLGGATGLAALGAIMNYRFSDAFLGALPGILPKGVLVDRLTQVAMSPRVLVDPDIQARLQIYIMEVTSHGNAVFQDIISVLKQSLQYALSEVFFIGMWAAGVALLLSVFLKEIPLRRQHQPSGQTKA